MFSPHPLDRLVQQDTFGELLALLEPEELLVAALRLEGLSDAQIGDLLGVSRAAVSRRMERASERIVQALPELASVLRGREQPRQRPPCNDTLPLEHGWLCRWNGDPPGATHLQSTSPLGSGLTVHDVARHCGVTSQTVTRWIRQGRFPHAYRIGGQRGDYRIPEEDLASSQAMRASRPSW